MLTQLSSISHLSREDQILFTQFGIGESAAAPFQCVHHAFEYHASAQPDAIAVEHNLGESVTYRQLDNSANRLAAQLRGLGVTRGSRICLLAQRSIQMVIGILATLKAGAAYVPLDGSIVTQSTLEHVLLDSGCAVVLAFEEYRQRVEGIPVVVLDNCIVRDVAKVYAKPQDVSTTLDPVYIIYTSGTTGKPKGVEIRHGNVTNLVCLSPGNVGMRPGMRVSQLLNIAFDMAAWETLGSMCNGCTLCIRGKSSKEWRAIMKTVDVVIATPSMMIPHDPKDYSNIKYIATAGEACPQSLADAWADQTQFYNSCGPTEITIVNTVQLHIKGNKVTIGRPTPNNNVYILDENMRPLPIGEAGIMWAGGAGISNGYLNLPEKTGERYKPDPFVNDGSLMFNTGDLGRWREDGTLDHLGRVDDQVKVKGFRVELDGVSAAMEAYHGVTVAAALLVESQLWGFITPATVDLKAVLAAAAKIQPYYAVPTQMMALDAFPTTGNGKIDKRALRLLAMDKISESGPINEKPAMPPTQDSVKYGVLTDISASMNPPPSAHRISFVHGSEPSVDSTSSSTSTLAVGNPDVEKALPWADYDKDELPPKTQGHIFRNFRHQIFTLYRRLFGVVFLANVGIFIWTIVRGNIRTDHVGLVVVANLFCAILMRQDHVINAFFTAFSSVPQSWPLWFRRFCARVYHIGGLHSGCAVAGFMWLILFTVQATREVLTGGPASIPVVVLTYWILCLLGVILLLAYPRFRTMFHNQFETTHRFLGWTSTASVWALFVILINDYRESKQTLGQAAIRSPSFWLILVMSLSIVLPWVRLRKVPVRAVVLSNHAVRLHFDYGVTPVAGSFTRISDKPLTEWHSFATVPVPEKSGYSVVVSRAGDWTSKQIDNPPTELWVRGVPTLGVLRIVPLFKRIVLVATGSGIGPCVAPCAFAKFTGATKIRLLWTAPNVRQTFGDELVDSVLETSPDAVIYDTRTHGKPDMVKLTFRLVQESNAEAVCIISNPKLTRKVVYGMMSRGIPAYGAIWDS